ncbi:TAP-like protein-domain-containing protein [Tricladium varicosporioides]|nr:TAP-like protein-domain-containing protein [Hymenoscyphus varicosporioides]
MQLEPAKELIWHPCYDEYDCARLDVPLDWLEPSEEHRASIAVIRYNATDKTDYKGSVFINPGGPGGSGVWFMTKLAKHYQTVVGKNYDIISFDPRGVGYSTPHITCFSTPQSSLIWDLLTPPVLDAHPGTISDAFAYAAAFSRRCTSSTPNPTTSPNSLEYVSTASTAADMLALHLALNPPDSGISLNYWGFSYGTYLGLTFASLYPQHTGHFVLDGNVDAVEYSGGRSVHFITDSEAVMDAFFYYCHLAGPSVCSFWADSPGNISARLDTLLENVKINPVIVSGTATPGIVSFSTVRRVISSSLYRPLVMFPLLADALAALEEGNGKPFLALVPQLPDNPFSCSPLSPLQPTSPVPSSHPSHGSPISNPPEEYPLLEGSADATKAILCTDMLPVPLNVTDFSLYVQDLQKMSRSVGATMAEMRLDCVGWGVRGKWRFDGPFTNYREDKSENHKVNILFVSNKADNVTPLRAARRNARGFPGSRVLVQNSYGHTSLSTPSRCTAQAIRLYFQSGILPIEGMVCQPELVPFGDMLERDSRKTAEDEAFDEALRELMLAPVVGIGFS